MLRDDGQASALYRKVIAECERTRAAAAAAAEGEAATEPAASAREEANAGEEAGFWDTESTLVLARYNLASVLMLTRPGGEARREACGFVVGFHDKIERRSSHIPVFLCTFVCFCVRA